MAFVSFATPKLVSGQVQSVQKAQPIKFIENKKQWEAQVLYKLQLGSSSIYLEQNTVTFDLVNAADLEAIEHPGESGTDKSNYPIRHHAYKMHFVGSNPNAKITRAKQSAEYYNFLNGNNPAAWSSYVYGFGEVQYRQIYSGIDLKFYSSGENMKYDFIVKPGADINQIKIQYEGTDGLEIQNSNLIIHNTVNTITESKPYAYQYRNNLLTAIACEYVLNGNEVSFNLNTTPS